MIKRINISQLKVGMYISDINMDWMPHNKIKQKGFVRSDAVIERIRLFGVKQLYIDTEKGMDSQDAQPLHEVDLENESKLTKAGELPPRQRPKIPFSEEIKVADQLHSEAKGLVANVMDDVKLGKAINILPIHNLADGMLNSIFRNHNALACLGRIRNKDSYLMEHSVNLSVLMSIFGKSIQMPKEIMQDGIIGALLHDIGKVFIPDEVLNKPGRLSEEEFDIMKKHVIFGKELLIKTKGVPELSILIMGQHHERLDGSGYPDGLKGNDISPYGKMVAIVDVYDAITADRCYHKGMTPTQGIKKLLEWSDFHLDRNLVNQFIQCLGIYPVGSLVLLESGRVGIVIEANEQDQRLPVLRLMYHSRFHSFIKTEIIDLSQPRVQDRIIKAVNPEEYKISINDFL